MLTWYFQSRMACRSAHMSVLTIFLSHRSSRTHRSTDVDEVLDLGPYTTIASLSLGTSRAFRLRETPSDPAFIMNDKLPRTYEIILAHNTLCLMNAGCQERYKHT